MKLNLTRRHLGAGIATVSLAAAAVAGAGLSLAANAADPTFKISGIVLGVGVDETSRTVAWYSDTKPADGETVELATKADFSDKQAISATLAANITTDAATSTALTSYNGKAVLDDLKANTTYYYRIADKTTPTNVSTSYSFTTGTFGDGDFQFLFFGDPQIGSSGDAAADGDGWEFAMDQTKIQSPKAELYVSGGDQINTANNETEWNNFLKPDELRSIPWAATIGNHDVSGYAYEQHFALPNTVNRDAAMYTSTNKTSVSGGDYYYTYKGVLFIDLNSNAYSTSTGSDPAHVQFVTDTITAQKAADPDIKHVVLVYHHSIYSPADHANDTDNQQRRGDFTKAFSDAGVDLVLQGHDHSYSRTYALKGTALGSAPVKADANEQPGQATVVENVGGVVYVTANSASGSKYYDLTEPDATKNYGADTLIGGPQSVKTSDKTQTHVRHWANSVENQEHVQTYIEVTVNEKGVQVKNVRANDNSADKGPNPAVDRGNVTGIGPNLSTWTAPIGSIQDEFSIFRTAADISPIVPPADVKTLVETITAQPTATPTVTITAQPTSTPTVTQTATATATATTTKTVTKTVTKEVVPAKVKADVNAKIASLTKQIKKAKGAKKEKLKAQLAAYKAIRAQLK